MAEETTPERSQRPACPPGAGDKHTHVRPAPAARTRPEAPAAATGGRARGARCPHAAPSAGIAASPARRTASRPAGGSGGGSRARWARVDGRGGAGEAAARGGQRGTQQVPRGRCRRARAPAYAGRRDRPAGEARTGEAATELPDWPWAETHPRGAGAVTRGSGEGTRATGPGNLRPFPARYPVDLPLVARERPR